MLTKTGAKLLDFGLAKLREATPQAAADLRTAVTGSLTTQGTILGTIAYMPPEQLEGGEPDARSDLFALGCVIYEMITGERPFAGDSQASIIGAILHVAPPPLTSRNPQLPATLESAVMRCLAKHPDERWQTAAELRGQLKWIAAERRTQSGAGTLVPGAVVQPSQVITPPARPMSPSRASVSSLLPAGGAAVVGAVMTAVVLWQMRSPLPAREAVRFVVNVPADAQAAPVAGMNTLALSPSGRVLVFTAIRSGTPVLFRRDLNQLAAEAIPGTEGGVQPFFSPDGQWVGFFDADDLSLKKVALAGGSPVTVQVIKAQLHGATWLGRQHHRVRKTPGSAGTRQRVRRRADAADDARRRSRWTTGRTRSLAFRPTGSVSPCACRGPGEGSAISGSTICEPARAFG
jgi:serine/threonine-protein kinase